MKGQVSLEMLIVFAVFLVVIAFSLSSLSTMMKRNVETYNKMEFKMVGGDIANAAENACILGHGNVRKVKIPVEVDISYDYSNNEIVIEGENDIFARYIPCEIEKTRIEGTVYVKNIQGKIYIEN
ncbi:class III signal peptide-containing protein [Candidatus Micrarchaeota archaeon]|nr:class III signal peptide-containing protein [Candidatus Micrarchaeota archaeon]